MNVAITRGISAAFQRCELTHVGRVPIDLDRARHQHRAYVNLLGERGYDVVELPASDALPDCVFVEDTAVVTDDVAIITRPGSESRRAETGAVAGLLAGWRRCLEMESPASLDGGDVLVLGRRVWVGRTSRTNEAGIAFVSEVLSAPGYRVESISVSGCLHLKSAVTAFSAEGVVVNPQWVDPGQFEGLDVVTVDPGEPQAANVLLLDDVVVVAEAHARTRERLESRGVKCTSLDYSELAKAEGGLTCCSILLSRRPSA